MGSKWKIDGTYFETCNCDAGCPCVFLSAPTTGDCTALVGWHITNGHFDDVNLRDLNAVLAVHSPGHMAEVPWQAALYIDTKGNPGQQEALTQIFFRPGWRAPVAAGYAYRRILRGQKCRDCLSGQR